MPMQFVTFTENNNFMSGHAACPGCVEALAMLSETLFAAGVLPYYLHLLDRVQGAAHFEVRDETALALHAGINACLPGYLVPRLVREVPGAPGKSPLLACAVKGGAFQWV